VHLRISLLADLVNDVCLCPFIKNCVVSNFKALSFVFEAQVLILVREVLVLVLDFVCPFVVNVAGLALSALKCQDIYLLTRACVCAKGALEDCRWAFKVDENCVKAAVLQGRAHVGLKQYDAAIECYNIAKKIDPRKESVVNEYMSRAQIRRAAELDEQNAGQTFEASNETGLVSILDKVKQPGQPVIYYIGGLQVLRQRLTEPVARTLFRSNGGFELAENHCEMSRCLSCDVVSLSASDVQLTALYVCVLRDACVDDEENQCHVLAMKHLPQQLMRFIECLPTVAQCHDIASASVDLLLYLSQSARNRSEIVSRCDSMRLLSAAFMLAQRADDTVADNTQRLICNLAMSDKLRRQLRDDFEQSVLLSFNSLLHSDSLAATAGGTLSVKMMVNLCGDQCLRRHLSNSASTWSACVSALARLTTADHELISTLVSLLANMAINGTTSASQHDLVQLSGLCADRLTQMSAGEQVELVDRCYLLLSRVLKANSECVQTVVEKQFISGASRDLSHLLHHHHHHHHQAGDDADDALLSHCVAAVTACTLHSELSRQQLTDTYIASEQSVLCLLLDVLLSHERYDDVLIGNVALCLSHCVQLPAAVSQLTRRHDNTDLMMTLLVLARDQAKPTVQHNCAILIARLVHQHAPSLDRLRELHGLEILHTVLRHVDH